MSNFLLLTDEQLSILEDVIHKEVLQQSSLLDRELVDQYSDLLDPNDKKKHHVGRHIETGKIYRKIIGLTRDSISNNNNKKNE